MMSTATNNAPTSSQTLPTTPFEETPYPEGLADHLHSRGILLMREGLIPEAVSCMHTALRSLATEPCSGSTTLTKPYPSFPLEREVHGRLLYSVPIPGAETTKASGEVDDLLLQFRRALYFAPEFDLCFDPEEEQLHRQLCSGIMMYNIGLALHIMGLDSCRSDNFPCALHFYALAHNALRDVLRIRPDLDAPINLALLAVINNMAHVNAHQRNLGNIPMMVADMSRRFFTLMNMPRKDGVPSFSGGEYNVFAYNVCFSTQNCTNAAPAA